MEYHEPVLLREALDGLDIKAGGTYVDATFGGGGHSAAVLEKLDKKGKLFAFDQDEDAIRNTIQDKRFTLIQSNFRFIKRFMRYYNVLPVDGILADLGISSHQVDTATRGFSTRFDALLDMRMNTQQKMTARDIVNTYSEERLKQILSEYGEVDNSGKVASQIVSIRKSRPFETTKQLTEALDRYIDKRFPAKYLSRIFQALRIEVNDEINALKEFLGQSAEVLTKGGRLVVISYHSLEDRLVKHFLRTGKTEGELEKDIYGNVINVPFNSLTRKPVTPGDEEVNRNPRARSARMRIAEKN